jgi:hypothetical protein
MADINIIVAAQTEDARRQLAQLQQQVKNTSNQFGKAKGVHNQYGKQLDKNTRGLSTFAKSGLQQTGYQLGDLAVQLQGGTSFMQAFGQQGSQLLQIFGPFGALAGAAVAILGALGTAFMKSRGQVGSFSEELEDLNELITTGSGLTGTAEERYERLQKRYGKVTEAVKSLANAEVALTKIRIEQSFVKTRGALMAMASTFQDVKEEVKDTRTNFLGFTPEVETNRAKIHSLAKEYGLTKDGVHLLNKAFEEFKGIKTANEAIKKSDEVLAIFAQNAEGPATEAALKLREALAQMGLSSAEMERVLATMNANKGAIEEVTQATSILGKVFTATTSENEALATSIAGAMGNSFKSIINGTKSVKDAFKNMAAAIIDQLINVLIVQRLVGVVGTTKGIDGKITGGTGLAGILSGTSKRAMGGPVTTGQTYLVGERGPELFTAGSNGRIIPNNQMQGGGATVVQNINISTGVSQTVRAEIAQLMPQIANSAKAAVLDAKQRGGTFSKAF